MLQLPSQNLNEDLTKVGMKRSGLKNFLLSDVKV